MFEVTEEWIKAFQNGNGGWNRAQLESIEVEWPPVHGWIKRAAGKSISATAKARFEQMKGRTLAALKRERHSLQLPTNPAGSTESRSSKSARDAQVAK